MATPHSYWPVKNCLFTVTPWDSWTQAPVGFQSQAFWGPVSQLEVLKSGALYVESKPFTPQGDAGCSLPMVCPCGGGEVYGRVVYQPLLPISIWFFPPSFTRWVGVAQAFSGFLSEEICLYIAVDLACLWEEVSSGAFYVGILNGNLKKYCERVTNNKTRLKNIESFPQKQAASRW